jgi:hypothetical protein
MEVQDVKPNMVTAFDAKPNNVVAQDVKSNMVSIDPKNEIYYPITITAGMPMGLLLSLTYKDGFTVMSSKSF